MVRGDGVRGHICHIVQGWADAGWSVEEMRRELKSLKGVKEGQPVDKKVLAHIAELLRPYKADSTPAPKRKSRAKGVAKD